MTTRLQELYQSTPLQGANAAFIEALYEEYLEAPERVPAVWRRYFDSLGGDFGDIAHGPIVSSIGERMRQPGKTDGAQQANGQKAGHSGEKQAAVSRLIQVYSLRGHQIADIDPLGPDATACSGRSQTRFSRSWQGRLRYRVLHRWARRLRQFTNEASRYSGEAEAYLLRQTGCRVCAHFACA